MMGELDLDTIAAEQAPRVAKALLSAAKEGGTEADFRRKAARILEDVGSIAGLTIVPRDEFSVARGHVDSVYNRLILEYKRPRVLTPSNSSNTNRGAIEQVKKYIEDVGKRERREAHRLAGIALDGFLLIFVRQVGEGWAVDDPVQVNAASIERLLRLLFSLAVGVALVPENLVEDFGPRTIRAQRAVRALYAALHSSKHPLVGKLFEQWRQFFSEATDYKEWADSIESKEEFRTFVKGMGLDPKYAEGPKVFFALHTYYALLIKMVASLAAARFAGQESAPLVALAAKERNELREAFVDLERGGLFREYGIRNFLEGDFFGWYLAAWNEDIEDAVGTIVKRLAEYDPGTLELAPENARDLLKKLYHYLLPREIRHDLGEYYTPDWLAERLIIQTLGTADLGDATKRVLDPACGSGTFLVILIKHIRERAARRNRNRRETLELILQNVVGFDLNPLAVIAARTNYILALGDLLQERTGDIDIPVYQADSVLAPSQGNDLFDGDVYPLKTSVGLFRVPVIFGERERMDALANTLDEAVEDGIGDAAFISRLTKAANLQAEELEATETALKAIYHQLRDLHDQQLNGVWARIIKNQFAPVFLELCHYIVGNPPWVNWEHLPDDYRESTMPLWVHYGLFPKREKGMHTILGAAKYDISMLMTYVSADKYLRNRGKLGFVLSQSLFKTSGAGQGFRRFTLPDKTAFGPLVVEDMVDLKPFEGATNRTVVGVFAKGHSVRYPVSYPYWKKRVSGRGGSIGFDTPYEEVTTQKVTFRTWHGEPVDGNDRTSSWITARRSALNALHNVLGDSSYEGREGVNTGGANGVFWVDITGQRPGGIVIISNVLENVKKKVAQTQAAVEGELVFPLLKGSDVSRWSAAPSLSIILTHRLGERLKAITVEEMQKAFPKTYSYLLRFHDVLVKRPALKRYFKADAPFYSLFNIGDYTFSPWKVVWRRVANEIDAAVANMEVPQGHENRTVPAETLISVSCKSADEAHYLCAVLNSAPARLAVRNYIVLHPDPHVLRHVRIPLFTARDKTHMTLSRLSLMAHKVAKTGNPDELPDIEKDIDELAAKLWNLSDSELQEIRRSIEEM